jgi:hypothetical protein
MSTEIHCQHGCFSLHWLQQELSPIITRCNSIKYSRCKIRKSEAGGYSSGLTSTKTNIKSTCRQRCAFAKSCYTAKTTKMGVYNMPPCKFQGLTYADLSCITPNTFCCSCVIFHSPTNYHTICQLLSKNGANGVPSQRVSTAATLEL